MNSAFDFTNWSWKKKLLTLAAILGVSPIGASAQNTEWLNNDLGLWFNGLDWSADVPTSESVAVITNGGTARINEGSFTALFQQLNLGVNAGQSGHVELLAGTVDGLELRVGYAAGGSGSVLISGGTWNSQTFYIGDDGTGSLNLNAGTVVGTVVTLGRAAGAQGTATVSGGVWNTVIDIYVGLEGSGTLEITSGTVSAGQHVYLGLGSGSGTLRLDGGVLATRQVALGDGGGTLRFQGGTLQALADHSNFLAVDASINEGGAVIDSNGYSVGIGAAFSGTGGLTKVGMGTLTLSGSNTHSGGTVVKAGTLAVVENGALSHAGSDLVVGASSGDNGSLHVDGGTLVGRDLIVGNGGTGEFLLEAGTVTVTGTTTVGASAGANGSLTLSGGGLSTMRVVQGAGDAQITLNGGTLQARADENDFISGNVTIGSGGARIDTNSYSVGLKALSGTGGLRKLGSGVLTLSGSNTYAGATHVESGTLVVGNGVSISHTNADLVVGHSTTQSASVWISNGQISSSSGHIGADANTVGEVRMNGGTWTNGSDLYVGDNGTGSLILEGGASVSSVSGVLGAYLNSSGAATVTNGTWQMSGGLTVGRQGKGALLINGGYVSSDISYIGLEIANAGGVATVASGTWQTASFLYVGYMSSGTLTVNGGLVTADAVALGSNGGHGLVTVSSGTLISASDLDIASTDLNASELVVEGGLVSNASARLGLGGTATVTSGTWHNTSVLDVGNGSLTISGGLVTSGTGRIGNGGAGHGEATVSGGSWEANQLIVGNLGAGSLAVSNGGIVQADAAVIGSSVNSQGSVATVTGAGSQFVVVGNLIVGDHGSQNTLTVQQGALVKVGELAGDTLSFSVQGGSGNLLQLNAGYVALVGDQTGYVTDVLLANGNIEVWNGTAWVSATDNPLLSFTYYASDAEAFAATGYEYLGGYTILTTVPEPGTVALILLGLGTWAAVRRRKSSPAEV